MEPPLEPLTLGLVSMWGLVVVASLVVSIRSLCRSRVRRTAAKLGIAVAIASVLGLMAVGLAFASGGGGGCGGA